MVTQREMEAPDRRREKPSKDRGGAGRDVPGEPGSPRAGGGRRAFRELGPGQPSYAGSLIWGSGLRAERKAALVVGLRLWAYVTAARDSCTKEASGPGPSPPVTAAPANRQEEESGPCSCLTA